VERTLFLLRYISNTEVRRVIRAETTKIEAYNDFLEARLHVIYFQSLRTTLPARYDISEREFKSSLENISKRSTAPQTPNWPSPLEPPHIPCVTSPITSGKSYYERDI
jgi:hypothetical protein